MQCLCHFGLDSKFFFLCRQVSSATKLVVSVCIRIQRAFVTLFKEAKRIEQGTAVDKKKKNWLVFCFTALIKVDKGNDSVLARWPISSALIFKISTNT